MRVQSSLDFECETWYAPSLVRAFSRTRLLMGCHLSLATQRNLNKIRRRPRRPKYVARQLCSSRCHLFFLLVGDWLLLQ